MEHSCRSSKDRTVTLKAHLQSRKKSEELTEAGVPLPYSAVLSTSFSLPLNLSSHKLALFSSCSRPILSKFTHISSLLFFSFLFLGLFNALSLHFSPFVLLQSIFTVEPEVKSPRLTTGLFNQNFIITVTNIVYNYMFIYLFI